jgi:outer membrane protein
MLFFPNAAENAWQPFIGVGVNCTDFFDEQTDDNFESVFGHYSIELDNSWGLKALAWWIDVDTKATVKSPTGVGLGVQSLQVDAQIDPVVYQLGFYRKF